MRGRGLIAAAALLLAAPLAAQTAGDLPLAPAGPAPQEVAPAAQIPAAQILTLDKERLFSGSAFGQAITDVRRPERPVVVGTAFDALRPSSHHTTTHRSSR